MGSYNNRKCGQSVVPQLDETPLPCDGNFVSSDCVIMSSPNIFLGVKVGDNLKSTIDKLEIRIKKQEKAIIDLKKMVRELTKNK